MQNNLDQNFSRELTWVHRAHLSIWAVRELWILCKVRLETLLLQQQISSEKHMLLLKKFKSLYEEASTRKIKTSTDILLIESDIRLTTYMLQELGTDATQELIKSFTENQTNFLHHG